MDGYLYETHSHTAQTSPCGKVAAAELVDRCRARGCSGLVITDHLHSAYLSRVDTGHDWNAVIDHYLSGYRAAKARGDQVGMDVILGAELRFAENENDYLIYGIDEAWLRANPYVCRMSAREFYAKFHDQLLIIHAHPRRDGNDVVFEDAVHGVELINAHPRHENRNDLALELCRRRPDYYRLAGSDIHRGGDEGRSGVLLSERVKDSHAYRQMIQAMRFRLWSPPFQALVEADEAMRKERG